MHTVIIWCSRELDLRNYLQFLIWCNKDVIYLLEVEVCVHRRVCVHLREYMRQIKLPCYTVLGYSMTCASWIVKYNGPRLYISSLTSLSLSLPLCFQSGLDLF